MPNDPATNAATRLPFPDGSWGQVCHVTPDLAAEWLSLYNNHNRRISARLAARLAADMERGDFPWTADPVRFAGDPFEGPAQLLDGQHRLEGVQISGIPQDLLIVGGLPLATQRYMDAGRVRSASDQLKIDGLTDTLILAAAARMILAWREGTFLRPRAFSNPEVVGWIADNQHLSSSLSFGHGVARRLAGGPSIYTAWHFETRGMDPYVADHFMTTLESGADIGRGHPMFTLRRTLEKSVLKTERPARVLYRLLRAWSAWVEGRELHAIPVPTQLTAAHFTLPAPLTDLTKLIGLPSQLTIAAGASPSHSLTG